MKLHARICTLIATYLLYLLTVDSICGQSRDLNDVWSTEPRPPAILVHCFGSNKKRLVLRKILYLFMCKMIFEKNWLQFLCVVKVTL